MRGTVPQEAAREQRATLLHQADGIKDLEMKWGREDNPPHTQGENSGSQAACSWGGLPASTSCGPRDSRPNPGGRPPHLSCCCSVDFAVRSLGPAAAGERHWRAGCCCCPESASGSWRGLSGTAGTPQGYPGGSRTRSPVPGWRPAERAVNRRGERVWAPSATASTTCWRCPCARTPSTSVGEPMLPPRGCNSVSHSDSHRTTHSRGRGDDVSEEGVSRPLRYSRRAAAAALTR